MVKTLQKHRECSELARDVMASDCFRAALREVRAIHSGAGVAYSWEYRLLQMALTRALIEEENEREKHA